MLIPKLHRILCFGISIGKYKLNLLKSIYIFFNLDKYEKKVPHTFPVPPLNKGTLNSLKITEPSPERSAEQGTFGGSLHASIRWY